MSLDPVIVTLLKSELHRNDVFVHATVVQLDAATNVLTNLRERLAIGKRSLDTLERFIVEVGLNPEELRKDK